MKKILLSEIVSIFVCCGAYAYDNKVISKLAPYANYSFMRNKELTLSEETQTLDIRRVNCANKDLSKYTSE